MQHSNALRNRVRDEIRPQSWVNSDTGRVTSSDSGTGDTEREQWLSKYTDLLLSAFAERGYTIDRAGAGSFIEHTIAMIANATGTTERDARLSISQGAVPAWVHMIEEAGQLGLSLLGSDEYVAVSGAAVLATRSWFIEVAQVLAGRSDAVAVLAQCLDAIGQAAVDQIVGGSLEVVLLHSEFETLVSVVDRVATELDDDDVVGGYAERVAANGGEASYEEVAELIEQLSTVGDEIAESLAEFHRHLADDPDDVLTYPTVLELLDRDE
ncbi:hypothetical protein GOOTI_221_00160 [Gordonia otitidis NBRC 100426]|uniref:Uncharacterized protein n=1 Tax=Gordonia otitidis (strain DSM 44809 / CCUG 52243 / JCM 12355 / NBRC 100426 / IFM 10032) TaxID=1108044 RepID=H5TSL5_GORO1|nr:hypothetical protein GOOTI_221_00160 [Gordonia otitidis NBRC 100426]